VEPCVLVSDFAKSSGRCSVNLLPRVSEINPRRRRKSGEGRFHHHEQNEGSITKIHSVNRITLLQFMPYSFNFGGFATVRADDF